MPSNEFRVAYRTARIKHEDAHHSFPFDNCYMPECKAVWDRMTDQVLSTVTDPRKQLELLAAHQQELEDLLHKLTGLTVKVSLNVHSPANSATDLLHLFEASLISPDFRQVNASDRTWIAQKGLNSRISIFMPEGFDADELYPEPEDDEGYNLAVETANAQRMLSPEGQAIEAENRRAEGQLKRNDDEIPF